MTESTYDILGVSKSYRCEKKTISSSNKNHPDIAGNTDENMEMFSKVQKAIGFSDPIKEHCMIIPLQCPHQRGGSNTQKSWRK